MLLRCISCRYPQRIPQPAFTLLTLPSSVYQRSKHPVRRLRRPTYSGGITCGVVDPLQAENYNSWALDGLPDDWDSEDYEDNELLDIVFEEDGSKESFAQNVLAIALSLLLFAAAGSILWRIAAVALTLVSAALRYSVVAIILLVLAVFFL